MSRSLAGSRPLSSRHWTQLLLLKAGNWPAIQFPRCLSSSYILPFHSSPPTPSHAPYSYSFFLSSFLFFLSLVVRYLSVFFLWYRLPPSPSQVWTSFVGQPRVKWSAGAATEREQASSPTPCFYLARARKENRLARTQRGAKDEKDEQK